MHIKNENFPTEILEFSDKSMYLHVLNNRAKGFLTQKFSNKQHVSEIRIVPNIAFLMYLIPWRKCLTVSAGLGI